MLVVSIMRSRRVYALAGEPDEVKAANSLVGVPEALAPGSTCLDVPFPFLLSGNRTGHVVL